MVEIDADVRVFRPDQVPEPFGKIPGGEGVLPDAPDPEGEGRRVPDAVAFTEREEARRQIIERHDVAERERDDSEDLPEHLRVDVPGKPDPPALPPGFCTRERPFDPANEAPLPLPADGLRLEEDLGVTHQPDPVRFGHGLRLPFRLSRSTSSPPGTRIRNVP